LTSEVTSDEDEPLVSISSTKDNLKSVAFDASGQLVQIFDMHQDRILRNPEAEGLRLVEMVARLGNIDAERLKDGGSSVRSDLVSGSILRLSQVCIQPLFDSLF
jgi:hypothetical protein